MQKSILLGSVFFIFLCAACKKEPEKVISINPSEFSTEDQIKIGKAFQNAITMNTQDFKILNKETYAAAYSYITTLLNTLVQTSPVEHRDVFEWTINIIHDDSTSTAFFLPGGHLFIYTGLLKFLDSESQLLGIMGHEMYYTDTDLMILKMKDEFGGNVLGDILLGHEASGIDALAPSIPEIIFDNETVMVADSFSIRLICPFLYEPSGIIHVIEKASRNTSSLEWLNVRVANEKERLQKIAEQAIDCGLPGVQNDVNYRKFKEEYLP